jgi:hypothetical protein
MKKNQIQLSAEELQTLARLEIESALLDKQREQSRVSAVSEAVRVARNLYVSAPTDTNLDNLKYALLAEAHFSLVHTNAGQIATAIELARTAFTDNKLKSFAAPILERALSGARKNFESAKKSASAKIEDATGHPYHDGIRSKPIDEARAIVTELEALAGSVSATTKFFAAFRAAFAL